MAVRDFPKEQYLDSPFGIIRLIADSQHVLGIAFKGSRSDERLNQLGAKPGINVCLEQAVKGLSSYCQFGHWGTIPYRQEGTEFQQAVWEAIAQIPLGKSCSYQELAKCIGRPKSYRAVAQACGANKLSLLIPCHRVLGSGGSLGGYSGGLAVKPRLLVHEQTFRTLA